MREIEARIDGGAEVLVIRVTGTDEVLREAQEILSGELRALMTEVQRREVAREPRPCEGCGEGTR